MKNSFLSKIFLFVSLFLICENARSQEDAVPSVVKPQPMTTIGNTWKMQVLERNFRFENGVPREEFNTYYIITRKMVETKQVGDKIYSSFRAVNSNWKGDPLGLNRRPNPFLNYSGNNEILMREENDKIYVLFRAYDFENDPRELVVFDYNLKVGDTIPCNTSYTLRKGNDDGDHFDFHKSGYVFVTKKVDTLFYAGADRRIYYFEPGRFSLGSKEFISLEDEEKIEGYLGGTTLFVEGIGFINQYGVGLCFNYPYGITGPAYGGLEAMDMPRCFIDADGVSYFITPIIDERSLLADSENPNCDYFYTDLGNEEIISGMNPEVCINGDNLVVEVSDFSVHSLKVYDSSGKLLSSCPSFIRECPMELSPLKGICLFITIDNKVTLRVIP